jgi:hypothetical protein
VIDLFRATPAVTMDIGFLRSPSKDRHLAASYDTQGDVEDIF